MGCYNGTCGITNLSIRHGEPVVYFLLANVDNHENHDDGFCHAGDIWGPIALPVYANYNDYGSIEKFETNEPLAHLIQLLHDYGVKVEPKNEYRAGFDPQEFDTLALEDGFGLVEDALHEGVLRIRDICGFESTRRAAKETGLKPSFRVGLVMIHREVYEELCKSYPHWLYEHLVPFSQVLDDAYKAYDLLVEKIDTERFIGGISMLRLIWDTLPRDETMFTGFFDTHEGDVYITQYRHAYADRLIQHAKNGDEKPALIAEICRFQIFSANMMALRKFWSPQSGAGSQHDNFRDHERLNRLMTKMVDDRIRQFNEDNEGYEDEL